MSVDAVLYGKDLFGEPVRRKKTGPLAERFEFPPFSVLDARGGDWQERKRAWLALGIQSELGRGDGLTFNIAYDWQPSALPASGGRRANAEPGGGKMPAADYSKGERGDGRGRPIAPQSADGVWLTFNGASVALPTARPSGGLLHQGPTINTANGDAWDGGRSAWQGSGTSIFDPVLCELMYRWFCPPGGQVVDPFAGGSVRGLTAGLLGFRSCGIELRHEQVQANEAQLGAIAPETDVAWVCGDSLDLVPAAPRADFIFSCPPYGDLERYSDDPRDLSTMEYHAFIAAYKRIILRCAEVLKPDRFACFVVGDFRDPKGFYRGFVADTIESFREVGMPLYNDAILVTAVGSLPVRVSGQFSKSRKLGKTHQNVLCFAKGDPRRAFSA